MTAEEKYEYWLDITEYNLETAKAMLAGGRWLYVVFMCQQAIEKLVKGLYILYVDDDVPRLHNIKTIFKRFEDKLPPNAYEERYDFFDTLTTYYLNNRYPEYINKLSLTVDKDVAIKMLAKTEGEFKWLLTLHP